MSKVVRWPHNPKVEGSNPSPATSNTNGLQGFRDSQKVLKSGTTWYNMGQMVQQLVQHDQA